MLCRPVCRTPDLAQSAGAKTSIVKGNAVIANIGICLKNKNADNRKQ